MPLLLSLKWFQRYFFNAGTLKMRNFKNGWAYPHSAKLSFKNISKEAGQRKPWSAVMSVAHTAQGEHHPKVLVENKGKKRRENICCLFISVISTERDLFSKYSIKTIAPAKCLEWPRPQQCLGGGITAPWTVPLPEIFWYESQQNQTENFSIQPPKIIDPLLKDETAVFLSKSKINQVNTLRI